ncbi:hypothetical protein J2X55_002805 [Microbacterium sp. 1154]|nr:hypothetical protein [Microbacterium sp. 1154]
MREHRRAPLATRSRERGGRVSLVIVIATRSGSAAGEGRA